MRKGLDTYAHSMMISYRKYSATTRLLGTWRNNRKMKAYGSLRKF